MRSIALFSMAAAVFLLPACANAGEQEGCSAAEGVKNQKVQGFSISVYPFLNEKKFPYECAVKIVDPNGTPLFTARDHGLRILPVSGRDLNSDAESEAVIEGWSGGMHCCFTYWIISLGKKPGLLCRIYNEHPVGFEDRRNDGRVVIKTSDGRFDAFDGVCEVCSPRPTVYLRLELNRLKDVSAEFWPNYQIEIDDARRQLTSEELGQFRAEFSKSQAGDKNPFEETRSKVLTVVLAYLYGGKPVEAWKALDEMWPPQDKERIKRLILKTRGNGFIGRRDDD